MKIQYTQDDICNLIVADVEKRMKLSPSCVPVDIGIIQYEDSDEIAFSVNLANFHTKEAA